MLCEASDTGAIFLVGVGGVRHIPTTDEVASLSFVVASPAPGQAFVMSGLEVCAWAQRFGAWNYQTNDFIYVA